MKKALIFCMFILLAIIASNAQSPSVYTLSTDNGIFLTGDDAVVTAKSMSTVTFNLSPNQTYSLKFQGEESVEFIINGTTFTGYINKLTIATGNNPETLVMFIKTNAKGKQHYSYGS